MTEHKKQTIKVPTWFNQKLDDITKLRIKEATLEYVKALGPEAELPELNKSLYLSIIPELTKKEQKWAKVTSTNWNTYKHIAHKEYQNGVQNYIHSKAIKNDLAEARKQTPEPEQAEEEESYELVDVNGSDEDDMYHNAAALAQGKKIKKQQKEGPATPESGKFKQKTYTGPETLLGKRECPYVHHYIDDEYNIKLLRDVDQAYKEWQIAVEKAADLEKVWRHKKQSFYFCASPKNQKI